VSKKKEPKTDLWMPLWIGDYLADTMSLSTAQHGAYLLLLMAYWRNRGPLKNDDEDLRGIVKADAGEWLVLREKVLARFFTLDGDVTCHVTLHVWRHKRADEELVLAAQNKEAQQARTAKATAARLEKLNGGGDLPTGTNPPGGGSDGSRNDQRNVQRNEAPADHVTLSPSPSPPPSNPSGSHSVAKATGAPAATPPPTPRPVAPKATPAPTPRPARAPVPLVLAPAPTVVRAAGPGDFAPRDPVPETEAERKERIWSSAKSLLSGLPKAQRGTFCGALARDYGFDVFAQAVESAVKEQPAEPSSYLKATCASIVGERQARSGKQATLEAGVDAVVEQAIAGRKHG
jgi:uncharacterized protein YdaU (DUF1376 family)